MWCPLSPTASSKDWLLHTTTTSSHHDGGGWWLAVGGWRWMVVVMEQSLSAWTEPPALFSRQCSPTGPPLRQASRAAV